MKRQIGIFGHGKYTAKNI